MPLQNTFLYRSYQKDKILFVGFVLFLTGQLYFTGLGIECFPFLHYGMYSAPAASHENYTAYEIVIEGHEVKSGKFWDAQREVVYNTLAAYDQLKQDSFHDRMEPTLRDRVPASTLPSLINHASIDSPYRKWLFSYIADMRMIQNPTIEVYKKSIPAAAIGALKPAPKKELLFTLRND